MSRTAAATRTVRVPGEPEATSQPAASAEVLDAGQAGEGPVAPAEGGQPFNPDADPAAAEGAQPTEPSLAQILARLDAAEQRSAAAEKRAAAAEGEVASLRAAQPNAIAAARAEVPNKKTKIVLPDASTINAKTITAPVQTAQGWIVPAPQPTAQAH